MSNYVLVIDTHKKPLNPCTPGMARSLLKAGKAAVFRRYPFTIILKKAVWDTPEPCQLKLDPGSKTTGITILQGNQVIWGAELTHRGQQIKMEAHRDTEAQRDQSYLFAAITLVYTFSVPPRLCAKRFGKA